MTRKKTKVLIASIILAGAVGFLFYAGISAGRSFYLSVDEYMGDSQYLGHNVRLHGLVAKEQLSINPDDRSLSFLILGESAKVKVQYNGVVPDLFQAGGEVVVVGRMGENGAFQAQELLTKCASKYEMRKTAMEQPL